MRIRIIADDLSGAADCAAAFAEAAGGELPVYLNEVPAGTTRFAVDTDSRAKDAGAASLATSRAMASATSAHDDALVFKKIDSTLRGHVGAELAAALEAGSGFEGVVVSPAFPEQNRALRQGKLYLDGHAFPPAQPASLVDILAKTGLHPALLNNADCDGPGLHQRIADALRRGARAVVVDAGSAEDLARIAMAVDLLAPTRVLVAGSAGLARALANRIVKPSQSTLGDICGPHRRQGPVIAVVGSFSAASISQVRNLADHGCAEVVRCDAAQWLNATAPGPRVDALRRAETQIAAGRNVVFAISGAPATHASRTLIQSIAATVVPLLQRASALVLTGGDTARAVLDGLGVQRLDVIGEFEPGISIGRVASIPGMRIFIKAGAFGDEMALRRVFEHLQTHRPANRNQELAL